MERRGSWLGYIAVGIGVLALVVALMGRPGWQQVVVQAPPEPVPPVEAARPVVPAEPVAPGRPLPEGGSWRHDEHHWRGHGPGFAFGGGANWRPHHYGPFGWLFGLVGDLVKLGLALLLIVAGVRLLRGWRGPGAGGGTNSAPGSPPPSEPPPSELRAPEPPSTGPTAYL